MPIIDITIPEGALDEKIKAALPAKLGQIALGYEGLSGSRFAEAFTWVYTHELPATHVTQVSGSPAKPIYRVRLTTLRNLLDDESKKQLGADIARAVYDAEGSPWDEQEAHNRIWIFFDDVREGDWIVGSRVNRLQELREAVEQELSTAP